MKEYSNTINFANEINKLLNNLVIFNPFRTIFSDYIPDLMTDCNMLHWSFKHVHKHEYKRFNADWVWPSKIEVSKFGDGILECKVTGLKYQYETRCNGGTLNFSLPSAHPVYRFCI